MSSEADVVKSSGPLASLRSGTPRTRANALKYEMATPKTWLVNTGRFAVFLVVLLLWEVGARTGLINAFFWSQPSDIAQTWWIGVQTGSVWQDTIYTFRSTVLGFLLGTAGGTLLGLSFWWSKYYARIFEPFIIMFEAMPKLALAPIIVLVFGIGIGSKIAMGFAITVVITTLTTYNGVRSVDRDLVRMVYSLGASRRQVFGKVIVPTAIPAMISALRINIGLALTGAIVGEYIGSEQGLGRMIFYAGQTYEISLIWANIFNLSILSMLLYLLVGKLEKVLLKGFTHK
ncbi:putative aliphatic sulfonates transport permease protein SsuC [compost metagenome]|uniref:ABC transporter permease n=1 Tax=Paenibacillus rhizolycopersici TaxID=2780073 RepID=A0ABS2HBM6_9BACL|nr:MULTISPECIES: ABC transporter permease [Paenibacillus]MBM6997813.1 ABC transporter permease [Paenibacillus rhizolycopersici]GIP47498.1 ABC transporter permease [Paenibacillus sp. J53TS2]